MRAEDILLAIRKRQEAMQTEVFQKPPQSMEDFKERKGIWIGLNDALSVIEDARKKELQDE